MRTAPSLLRTLYDSLYTEPAPWATQTALQAVGTGSIVGKTRTTWSWWFHSPNNAYTDHARVRAQQSARIARGAR